VSWLRRLAAGLMALVVVVALNLAPAGAAAAPQDSGDTADIQSQLEELEAQRAELDRQVTLIQSELASAQSALEQTRAELEFHRAAVAELEAQVTQFALQQYQNQGLSLTMMALTSDDVAQAVNELATGQQIEDASVEMIRVYQAERTMLEDLEADEAQVVADMTAQELELQALYASVDAQVEDTMRLLGRLTGSTTASMTVSTQDPAELQGVAGFVKPVNGILTSPMGYRTNPITGAYELHDGTDFGATCGLPIVAAQAGVVTEALYSTVGYGNRVVVDHGIVGGHHWITAYNHMMSYAVAVGDQVEQGQIVGYVGSTGMSTGCHLHWTVWVDGALIDGAALL
jgi:murein DD-endopeptidase MepM/ murein hydrolase activator NlpD